MIDEDKIKYYNAQMMAHSPDFAQFTAFVFNGITGLQRSISERELHGAVEYGIAQWKKDIEMCNKLTKEQKEEKKAQYEMTFRSMEAMLIDSLKYHCKIKS